MGDDVHRVCRILAGWRLVVCDDNLVTLVGSATALPNSLAGREGRSWLYEFERGVPDHAVDHRGLVAVLWVRMRRW